MLGLNQLDKHSGRLLARSGEIPSPLKTSIDKTNLCAMHCEQSALVRSSHPP